MLQTKQMHQQKLKKHVVKSGGKWNEKLQKSDKWTQFTINTSVFQQKQRKYSQYEHCVAWQWNDTICFWRFWK